MTDPAEIRHLTFEQISEVFGSPYADLEAARAEHASWLRAKAQAEQDREEFRSWLETRVAEVAASWDEAVTAQAKRDRR